jgi:hypothetical protein
MICNSFISAFTSFYTLTYEESIKKGCESVMTLAYPFFRQTFTLPVM